VARTEDLSRPRAVILTVDDDVHVLNAVERDLRSHYRGDYRIIKAGSGPEALETVTQLKQRNEPVALFLVDQRMPGMGGTDFLAEALKFYPDARRVLLTAYADTEAAIAAINTVSLDYYLLKPWDPPEERLYPVLDDLLSDWRASADLPYRGIRVAGTLWSPGSHAVKDFLARSQIPYQWLDIEKDAVARAEVASVTGDQPRLPVVFFPDGVTLVDPDITTLAEKAGQRTRASHPFYDLIIAGAGPAGLAAAVYGASEGLKTLLVEKETTGGQAGTSSRIENYLGFPQGLSGGDLARRATIQAKRLGAEVLTAQEVRRVRVEENYRFVTLADGTELSCHALVVATGVAVRELQVPGIEAVTGAGVYYGAALTEAAHYAGEHVYIIGGANSAGQGAIFLSRYASQVTLLVRSTLGKNMSSYLIEQIERSDNIDVLLRTEISAVHGADRLEAITYRNTETGEERTVPTPAIFIFIGARPHTEFLRDVVELSEEGFVLTGPDLTRNRQRPKRWPLDRQPYLMETSVPGIFAAGDVRHGVVRRVASAVGQGSIVVSFVHEYLKSV
jgi:thioredoxin reductase (NADPH)